MDFSISDDRRMLTDTLRRYLFEQYPVDHRTRVAYAAPFHDPAQWAALAGLGLFHALAPEDRGGIGGTGFDVAVVFEELGRALCPEPVLGQLMAIRLTLAAGGDLEPLLTGETRAAVALDEAEAGWDLDALTTRAADGRLTGRKTVVYGGAGADRLLVAAAGPGLWDVAAGDAEVAGYGMIDGGPAAEVFLDATPASCLIPEARAALEEARDWAALALSAEALGAMEAAFAMLTDYLATRKQFGQPIGTFQALQHRAVDLAIEIEQARSIVILAASAMDTPERAKRVSQAKHLVGRIARQVAEEVIQMHGGIAMTWEYPVSHYAKRLVMIDHQMGDSDWHLERLMGMLEAG
ncbi:acyl-CoA dehydrogenase family protein [Roseicyclus persicicus]|uniref:Acyl-CoA dehydrogenase n=1 Tax=Roseicyclus persicicus TaxID=2650661 RepID=A0A7X6GWR2_9RHOB|nr:acyl-CoA dehydrogenase family protein [Roseibacterium persicicum]NKX43805.1 acyl-CoA dehydrogenase [Roseibacterium persicicum]